MAQARILVDTLKRALRARGLTYASVAEDLGVSEASVKRMFSRRAFTLDRLDAICAMLEMELTDLLDVMAREGHRITRLTFAQEQELVSDIKLLLVAVCARNRWSFHEIVEHYAITKTECIRLLARLDRLRLIELLPGNRIKLRITQDFRWMPHGPIERFFESRVQREFLRSAFDRPHELRLFLTGPLSPASQDVLMRRLETFARDFAELHHMDSALPLPDRNNVGVVLAMRPWELHAFRELRRSG